MKSIAVSDLRPRWLDAKAALPREDEILTTRNSKLVCLIEKSSQRRNRNPQEHLRWLKRTWRNKSIRLVDKYLKADREDR